MSNQDRKLLGDQVRLLVVYLHFSWQDQAIGPPHLGSVALTVDPGGYDHLPEDPLTAKTWPNSRSHRGLDQPSYDKGTSHGHDP
jgi:hypothetical protein